MKEVDPLQGGGPPLFIEGKQFEFMGSYGQFSII